MGHVQISKLLTTNAHLEKPHQVPPTLTRYSLLLPACHHGVTGAGGTCLPCCTSDWRQGTSGVANEVLGGIAGSLHSHAYKSCATCRLEALLFKRLCRGSRGVVERERPTRKEQNVASVEGGFNVTKAGRWQLWSVSQPAHQVPQCLGLPHIFHAHVPASHLSVQQDSQQTLSEGSNL